MNSRPPLYLFNWPSNVGGRIRRSAPAPAPAPDFDITVVAEPAASSCSNCTGGSSEKFGVKGRVARGVAPEVARHGPLVVQRGVLAGGIAGRRRPRAAHRVVERMMWHHPGEIAAAVSGLSIRALCVGGAAAALARWYGNLPSAVTGNYIDPQFFRSRTVARAAAVREL